jgi:hypothetical protein
MDGAGQNALARAILTPNQNRRLRGGDTPGEVQHAAHSGIVRLDARPRNLAADPILQVRDAVFEPPDPGHPLQDRSNLARCKRFGQIIERPPAHRVHRRFQARVCRDNHARQPRRLGADRLQQIQPGFVPEPEIHQGRIIRRALRETQGRVRCPDIIDSVPGRLGGQTQRVPDVRLVIDDQDSHRMDPLGSQGGSLRADCN